MDNIHTFIFFNEDLLNQHIFFSVEIIGKHPDETQTETYDVSRDLPVFMSVSSDQNMTEGYAKYLVACNAFFESNYA